MSVLSTAAKALGGVGVGGALFGLDTAAFLGEDVLAPALEGAAKDSLGQEIHDVRREQEARILAQMKARRLQQARADNLERLARMQPDIYNQIAAGKPLPKGAAVFGGKPDVDLLQRVADMMERGGFQRR